MYLLPTLAQPRAEVSYQSRYYVIAQLGLALVGMDACEPISLWVIVNATDSRYEVIRWTYLGLSVLWLLRIQLVSLHPTSYAYSDCKYR
jgi:hypothetical protein